MSLNNSTFDAGFNITTADLTALYSVFYTKSELDSGILDARYFKTSSAFSELTSSTSYQVTASRNIFGYGLLGSVTNDCVIRTSGSGNVIRFNGTTGSFSPSNWSGSIIYDTGVNKLCYATDTIWKKIVDSSGGTIDGNFTLSGSTPVLNFTGSVGSTISMYLSSPSTKDFEISASVNDSNILHKNTLKFRSSSLNVVGSISNTGVLNFSSGSFTLGLNSSSDNIVNGNLRVTNTLSASAISCSGDIIAFSTSDERLKTNISPLTYNLNKLDLINAYSFKWSDESGKSGNDIGVIAQEIEKIFPDLVVTRENGFKAVDYVRLIPFLIGCIKELKQKIG